MAIRVLSCDRFLFVLMYLCFYKMRNPLTPDGKHSTEDYGVRVVNFVLKLGPFTVVTKIDERTSLEVAARRTYWHVVVGHSFQVPVVVYLVAESGHRRVVRIFLWHSASSSGVDNCAHKLLWQIFSPFNG